MNPRRTPRVPRDFVDEATARPQRLEQIDPRAQAQPKRGGLVAVAAAVVSFLAVVAASALFGHGASGSAGAEAGLPIADASATPADASAPPAPSPDGGAGQAPSTPPAPEGTPSDIYDPAAYTSLSECPDALAFAERPDIQQKFEQFGTQPLGPKASWYGGCPSVDDLEHMLNVLEDTQGDYEQLQDFMSHHEG